MSESETSPKCAIFEKLYELQTYIPRLKDGSNVEKLKLIIYRTLLALDAMHKLGWVHSDIKFDNLMLTKKHDFCSLKVIDFGLSKKIAKKTTTSQSGSPRYKSCNISMEHAYEIDIHSLAIFVFQEILVDDMWEKEELCDILKQWKQKNHSRNLGGNKTHTFENILLKLGEDGKEAFLMMFLGQNWKNSEIYDEQSFTTYRAEALAIASHEWFDSVRNKCVCTEQLNQRFCVDIDNKAGFYLIPISGNKIKCNCPATRKYF